jgi:uncharacterized protein YjgD (DUF1641 family)
MDKDLALLHEKIDHLTFQLDEQRKSQQAFNELKDDMIPIANHMIKLTIDELADIGTEFRGEDLLFLVKRLLRNTNLLIRLMDQLEGIMGMADEAQLLGKQVFSKTVEQLDEMERKGYFRLAGQGVNILDRIVTEVDEDEIETLGNTIVPMIKALGNGASTEKVPSMLKIAKQMNDPQVRIGLARMLDLLRSLADQPAPSVQ